ncbi:hypothetical protein BDW72DRAFT_154898 [Aspergillus terricola var. indicus]
MYPIIGIKMQYTSEHRHAFIADDYVLDGPEGPIAPADWNDKVYPGISVAIRLQNRDVHDDLDKVLFQSNRAEKLLSRSSQTDEDTDSLFGDDIAEEGAGAGDDDADSKSNIDRQPSSIYSSPDDDTSGTNGEINVFDYLVCEKDDDQHLAREGPPGVKNPFRYQVRNDAWKTKETLVEPRSSSSIPSTTLNPISSSSPTASSVTTPLLTLPSDQAASAAALGLSDSASISGLRPLFEWKSPSKVNHDFLGGSSNGRFGEGKPNDGGDSDVGALLEGCDKEALYILSDHPDDSAVMDNVSKSTYMQVQVEMERTRVWLLNLGDDSDSHSLERQVWARKERAIEAALHLLDCFIPLSYQKLDESWLIGKFFGAIYDIVRGSVSSTRIPTWIISTAFFLALSRWSIGSMRALLITLMSALQHLCSLLH